MVADGSLWRLGRSLARLVRTRYPRFVFGFPIDRGVCPSFVYHDVTWEAFAGDLRFLRDNGYRCVGVHDFVAQGGRCSEREVLLTFDDARRSFWTVAVPLLIEYGMRATLFVPTRWPGTNGFMTWDEIRAAAKSGAVDVQSHAHSHALVYTSGRLVGFATPGTEQHVFDWPMRHEGASDLFGTPPAGTPIYEAQPLLSAPRRVLKCEETVAACRNAAGGGDPRFFQRRGWASELARVHRAAARSPRLVDAGAWRSTTRDELARGRDVLARETGVVPTVLAFPWELGSDDAVAAARETGFHALFGVGMDALRVSRLRGTAPVFSRVRSDWIRFLPGHGRARLRAVIPGKVRSLLASAHVAQ